MTAPLTRRQQEILAFLEARDDGTAPTLDELCHALGLASRGSLHKHVQALIDAGHVEPMNHKQRGVRLRAPAAQRQDGMELPFLGFIAAGAPIEAVASEQTMSVPDLLPGGRRCYVLQVRGESMIEDGILDGDRVIIEARNQAANGETVVALIDQEAATLKRIEQRAGTVVLHPANVSMAPMEYAAERVTIQGVVRGLIRRYS